MITLDYLMQADGLHVELIDIATGLSKSLLIHADADAKNTTRVIQHGIDLLTKEAFELMKSRSKL